MQRERTVGGLLTGVGYRLRDERKTRQYTTVGKLFVCCFGVDCVFIGWDGQLWRLNPYDKAEMGRYWFMLLEEPKLHLEVEERNPRRIWRRVNGYRFECEVHETAESQRGRGMVHRAQLENMQHVLIRLQRWIRRVLGRERVRLASVALLMALHPRLGMGCALGELGHDILEGVICKLVGWDA